MIVELIGLPGCGKTTVQSAILKDSAFTGYHFITRDIIVQESIIYNWKWTLRLMYLDPRMWKILFFLNQLKRELPHQENRQVWFNRFCVMSWALVRNKKKNLILDEGVIQYISSIMHEEPAREYKSVQKVLSCFSTKMHMGYIHINTDEQTCLNRIRQRNRSNDRYNKIGDDEDLLRMLKLKKENILTIADMADMKFRLVSDGNIDKLDLERYLY